MEDFSETYGVFKGGHIRVLGVQLLACLTIGLWSAVVAFAQFYIIGKFIHFRFSEYEETMGADFCEHAVDHSTERQTPKQFERIRATLAVTNKVAPAENQEESVQERKKGLALFRSVGLALRGARPNTRVIQLPEENQGDSVDGENKRGLARFRSVAFAIRGAQRNAPHLIQVQEAEEDD